ncbi:MAG: HAD hydrolase family protein, partial [Ignavibacteria bacterium]|nr:HAD hydrolase family protein [Ignavibacteria bacterium]
MKIAAFQVVFYLIIITISAHNLNKKLSRIKLVVSDVDGTLTGMNNEVGEQTKHYVKRLKEKGVAF